MALMLLNVVLILGLTGSSDGAWCVCKSDVGDSDLQKTLDYACGAGADCSPIHEKGACFDPETVRAHCSYAANSFFQRNMQTAGACDFSATASLTNTDPSYGSCSYPASASTAGTSTNFTTANGVMGGISPSGIGMATDATASSAHLPTPMPFPLVLSLLFSAL